MSSINPISSNNDNKPAPVSNASSKTPIQKKTSESASAGLEQIRRLTDLQKELAQLPQGTLSRRREEIFDEISTIIKSNKAFEGVFIEGFHDEENRPLQVNELPEWSRGGIEPWEEAPAAASSAAPASQIIKHQKIPGSSIQAYQNLQAELKAQTARFYVLAYARLDSGEDPIKVRGDLYLDLNNLRQEANQQLAEAFEEIKQEATSLANRYNASKDPENDGSKGLIDLFNLNLARLNVADQSSQASHHGLVALQSLFTQAVLHGLDKNRPPLEEIKAAAEGVIQSLQQPGKVLSKHEIKEAFSIPKALKGGQNKLAVSIALSNPMNWTNRHGAAIQLSRAGTAYVAATEISPMGVDEKGGVPSGLRGKGEFEKRPVNLQHTKTYLLDQNGEPIPTTVHESFRGGVFASQEAAEETVRLIREKTGTEIKDLHVNALLTPVRGLLSLFKKDYQLLKKHYENIKAVLKEKVFLSNFGVNEGAVGKAKVGPVTLPEMAWHTSLQFTDSAVERLNNILQEKFSNVDKDNPLLKDPVLRDRVIAIVQLGRDMQAVWAVNDFASGDVGNNQFKLPAMWKAMDALFGNLQYLDCMSGKDRTSEVEANGQAMLHEIDMNLEDQRKYVREQLSGPNPWGSKLDEEEVKVYTTPILNEEDIKAIMRASKDGRKSLFEELMKNKVFFGAQALNVNHGELLEKKNVKPQVLRPGMGGIPKQVRLDKKDMPEALYSVRFASTGPYDTTSLPADRQRQAQNRRLEIQMATIAVTQQNTGVMGMKVKLTDAVVYGTCGFDVGYVKDLLEDELKFIDLGPIDKRIREFQWQGKSVEVLKQLRREKIENLRILLVRETGLDEIDQASREAFLNELDSAKLDISKLLEKIAKRKAASFKPPIHVSG